MRILIHGINYAPELTGVGKYTGEMAEWLAERGFDVRVVAAPPYYPYWKAQEPYRSWVYSIERRNRVRVYRCPLWIPSKNSLSGMKRILHLLSFALFSAPVLLAQLMWRPQLVISVAPSLFGSAVALLAAKSFMTKSWLHIQDFEVDAAVGLGMISSGRLAKWALRFESALLRRFDRVSSISVAMVSRLELKGVTPDRVFLLPNWVDCEVLRPLYPKSSLRKEWEIPLTSKVVLYAGNIGKKQGLELLFPVAEAFLAKRPDVLFIIVGEGAAKVDLERMVFKKGLRNIIFKPLQPIKKLGALLATADVHLVLQLRGAADLVMPSKLTGILAAGGAVLATAEEGTELYKVVIQNEVGQVVQPGSSEDIEMGIESLLDDMTRLQRYRHNARKFAETHLHKETILWDFEQELNRVVAPCGRGD